MKAWFVKHKAGDYGEIVLAETRGKAILRSADYDNGDWPEYINYRARRVPGADDVEYVRPETYIQNNISYPCVRCDGNIRPGDRYTVATNGYDVYCEKCNR